MKRSEMVSLIFDRLAPAGICEPTCEEVLTIIENAGMMPPFNYNQFMLEYHSRFISPNGYKWDDE